MIPEKLREILKQDGVVAIATLGEDEPHLVNTWNSYLRITEDGRLLIPAGYMHRTEAKIAFNPEVLITMGSSKVGSLYGSGAGFLRHSLQPLVRILMFSRQNSNGFVPQWPSPSSLPLKRGKLFDNNETLLIEK